MDRWLERKNTADQRPDISHKGNIELLASKDEEIRRLKQEVALKDEKMQHLENQLKVKLNAIKSACTDIDTAVKSAENAFATKIPPTTTTTGIGKLYQEKDLSGAKPSSDIQFNH